MTTIRKSELASSLGISTEELRRTCKKIGFTTGSRKNLWPTEVQKIKQGIEASIAKV